MNINHVILALLVSLAFSQAAQSSCTPQDMNFTDFVSTFNKTYANASEEAIRQGHYDNQKARLLNSSCCYCGVTKFFDRSPA